jgi:hypothetical protein
MRRFLTSLVAVAGLVAGCGSAAHPDPRPLNEGGIPDRILLEASAGDAVDGPGDGAPGGNGAAGGGAGGGAGGAGGGAGTTPTDGGPTDVAPLSTTVAIAILEPTNDALKVAVQRFTPLTQVIVTTDPSRSDDVKQVDAELWSTGTGAAKLSTTKLSLLNKVAGASGDAGADDGGTGPGMATTFTYGDTPVDLSSLTTGTYELRIVTATVTGIAASATRSIRVDAGPIIKVISPMVDQAARGSIFVSVQVIDPFSATPPTVHVSVANHPITPLTNSGDLYQATVSETLTQPPLSGQQLLDVGATNAAGVAARNVVVRFTFDDVGPVITNGRPATGTLIGGIVRLEADVVDPAGVDTGTVVAVVAHGGSSLEVRLDQDPNDKKHFQHLFDTRRLANTVLYPTISFRASDVPGNQSNIGYTVAVDNTPPLAELDPPADLRLRREVNKVWRCSWEFDPLGSDAVDDGDKVLQLFDVRARVQDQGNTPAGGFADITPLAGLDSSHVELLVLDDTNRALAVDTDNDGVCDAINPKLVPTTTPMSSQEVLLVNMSAIPPTGQADFTPDVSVTTAGFSDCAPGSETSTPPLLCRTSDLTVAIPAYQSNVPAIWSIPNIVPSTPQCVGNQLDSLGNHLTDGPACLAVRAIDQLGNAQVSRVLHICIDSDASGNDCPYAAISSLAGGTPVRVTTAAPHGLATGDRALIGGQRILFDANGLWTVTVVDGTTFTLDGSSTPATTVTAGQFMRWTASSDCTGKQTSLNPVAIDDSASCRPWRRYSRGEHLDVN